ncbi:hypothetical protein [Actinoplanes sp. NPDC026623]|uniref:hypothetical protein n=1 Tax=Actinoplanes sp. NPDC026623 TaxID=3155610 RepID=UPI0033D15690
MTNPTADLSADDDETAESGWITRWLGPGDLYRGEPLTDQQAGVELFDATIYIDRQSGLVALGHAIVQHFDAPDADTLAAAGLDPVPANGRTCYTWPEVARAALAKPALVYVATTDTRHYAWAGIGDTADQARDALMTAWYAHAQATGADPDHVRRDELNVINGPFGQGFIDYDPFPRP